MISQFSILSTFQGKTVVAQVTKCKRRYVECRLIEVLKQAPEEAEIPYQPIPGAPYATFPVDVQHKYKQETTLELYKRIAGVENAEELYKGFVGSSLIGITGIRWNTAFHQFCII